MENSLTDSKPKAGLLLPRLVLGARRTLFVVGAIPALLMAFIVGAVGMVAGMFWLALCWLTGSPGFNDGLCFCAMNGADWIWAKWESLITENAQPVPQ